MITVYENVDGVLRKRADGTGIGHNPAWIDLLRPTREEDQIIEASIGVVIPTRDEMEEIEASSRVYQEGGSHYMTVVALHQPDHDPASGDHAPSRYDRRGDILLPPIPIATAVTFVLAKDCLITVRYDTPRAFDIFLTRNQKGDLPCTRACGILVGLLEAIVDREADRVERVQTEIDALGHFIFDIRGDRRARHDARTGRDPGGADLRTRNRRLERALRQIGREGEQTSRSRESLQSLDRVLTYLAFVANEKGEDKLLRARIKTASRDVAGLNDQVNYVSNKVQFLLDAVLGMIGLEQNNIIKFFTVAAVALMPPTLIASIYGMNFKHMPELEWTYGYPLAIALMVLFAVVPFLWFRRKGWL